ncbi:hypothetical protein BD414DRAFT_536275 [Trametes punicea]|nr:hypothetical protein BD414DRAFT_536275 [Trametes punicea]
MDKAIQALRVAKTALNLMPLSVPGLGPSIELALNILELDIKDTHDDCKSLALRAGQLTYGIYQSLADCPSHVDITTTAKHVATLLCTLEDIQNLMKRWTKKRQVLKMVFQKDKLKNEVGDLNTRLDDALRLFGVQDAIATHGELAQISAATRHLVEHAENDTEATAMLLTRTNAIDNRLLTIDDRLVALMQSVTVSASASDNGMMVLYKEDLALVREVETPADHDSMCPIYGERIVRWQARIRKTNQSVIVAKFPRPDDRFRAAIQLSKRTMHPHIAPILGYSRPDSAFAFIVLDGIAEHKPLEEFIQSVHGVEKYTWTTDVAKQLQSAFAYMKEVGLLGTIAIPEESTLEESQRILTAQELYVTPEGTVRWDVYSWTKGSLPSMLDISDGYVEFHDHLMPPLEGLSIRDLRLSLHSQRPIERAQALLQLWDRLMQFTDFNRVDEFVFAPDEEFPWVGSPSHHLYCAPQTPEGKFLPCNPAEVEINRTFSPSRMYAFDEDEPEVEYTYIPDLRYLYEQVHNEDLLDPVDGQCRVVAVEETPDQLWRRHTVLDMDYGACFRSVQTVEEETKCRRFFTALAVNMDLGRYVADEQDKYGPVSIVHALNYIVTSYLVSLGPSPVDKPPAKLYFYERMHTPDNYYIFEAMPWGYWSTDAEPIRVFPDLDADWVQQRAFIKETKLEVQYLGVSRAFKFVWMQTVAGFVFRTEVMVAIQTYHWTEDEKLLLRELNQCLKEAHESSPESTSEEIRSSIRRKRAERDDSEFDDERRLAQRQRIV